VRNTASSRNEGDFSNLKDESIFHLQYANKYYRHITMDPYEDILESPRWSKRSRLSSGSPK
jgi:hypothetical protein